MSKGTPYAAHQDQPPHALRMTDRHRQRQRTAKRVAHDVRLLQPERVEQADRLRHPGVEVMANAAGRSLKPNPAMSGAITRSRSDKAGITSRQFAHADTPGPEP